MQTQGTLWGEIYSILHSLLPFTEEELDTSLDAPSDYFPQAHLSRIELLECSQKHKKLMMHKLTTLKNIMSDKSKTDINLKDFLIGFIQQQREMPLKKAGKPPKSLEKRWEGVDLSRPSSAVAAELGVSTQAVSARKRKMRK